MAETYQTALALNWWAKESTYTDPWKGAYVGSHTTRTLHLSVTGVLGPLCFLTCVISLEVMRKTKQEYLMQQTRKKLRIRVTVSRVCLVLIPQGQ